MFCFSERLEIKMTLDHLRYFTAVATYQHVGRAAKAVYISPSVISAAIASLQTELQCQLFRKTGRRIELTENGRRLLEQSKTILAGVDGLKTSLKGEPEELQGRYRLGASHFLAPRILLSGWLHLQKQHTKVVSEIYSMNTAHAIADVIAGRLELVVCFSPLSHPDLRCGSIVWARGNL
jgi:LysR family hydrogen peroxide-inducible transcriptional activator